MKFSQRIPIYYMLIPLFRRKNIQTFLTRFDGAGGTEFQSLAAVDVQRQPFEAEI